MLRSNKFFIVISVKNNFLMIVKCVYIELGMIPIIVLMI